MKVAITGLVVLAVLTSSPTAQAPFPGNTLISVRTTNESFMIDIDQNIIQTWTGATAPAQLAYLLPDGSVLRPCGDTTITWGAGGAGGRIQRIDANNVVVWDYFFSSDTHLQHHDIEPMPNGNVLIPAWDRRLLAEATAAGRVLLPGGEMWPTMIVEVEPVGATGGNIVWEWHLWDHLIQDADSTKANFGVVADHPELVDINFGNPGSGSWDHLNAIDYNPELDQILFSARKLDEVYVIDHSTTTAEAADHTGGNSGKGGDILYRWGNPQVYGRGTDADREFHNVHGGNWIDAGLPGAGNILVFANGDRPGSTTDSSKVMEIAPPVDANGHYSITPGQAFGPAGPVWFYEKTGFYSRRQGGAYRLPNGNTLITETAGNNVFEVTPAGTVVWLYILPGSVHRAPRYWDAPVPTLITFFNATNTEDNIRLSWDISSDQTIAGFRIYRAKVGDTHPRVLNDAGLISPLARQYSDTEAETATTYRYTLGVIDASGEEVQSQPVEIRTAGHSLVLLQNHPNPFNPTTRIGFSVPDRTRATLKVFNTRGQLVATLLSGVVNAGRSEIEWDGRDRTGNLASTGVYFYQFRSGGKTLTKKMVLLK